MGRGSKGTPACCGCSNLVNRLMCCARQDESLPPPPPLADATVHAEIAEKRGGDLQPVRAGRSSSGRRAVRWQTNSSGGARCIRYGPRREAAMGSDRRPRRQGVQSADLHGARRRDAIDEAAMLKSLHHKTSLASSASLLAWTKSPGDLVRGGGTVFDQLAGVGLITTHRTLY